MFFGNAIKSLYNAECPEIWEEGEKKNLVSHISKQK